MIKWLIVIGWLLSTGAMASESCRLKPSQGLCLKCRQAGSDNRTDCTTEQCRTVGEVRDEALRLCLHGVVILEYQYRQDQIEDLITCFKGYIND